MGLEPWAVGWASRDKQGGEGHMLSLEKSWRCRWPGDEWSLRERGSVRHRQKQSKAKNGRGKHVVVLVSCCSEEKKKNDSNE